MIEDECDICGKLFCDYSHGKIETEGSKSSPAPGSEPTGHMTEPVDCEDCRHCQTINDDMTMYCHKKKHEVYETCDDFAFC